MDPVEAWKSMVEDPARRSAKGMRGTRRLRRADWDEANEMIAASNVYTIKKYGPDRIVGFSPIPAMSMMLRNRRAHAQLMGGSPCRSTTGIATCRQPRPRPGASRPDVPESADWYNALYARLGLQPRADAHARRALLHRSAL